MAKKVPANVLAGAVVKGFLVLIFIRLRCTQQKTGQVHVEDLVEKLRAVTKRQEKANK